MASMASDHGGFGSINMDDLLNNIYSDEDGDGPAKTAEEVWREIVAGKEPRMTLEDFLTKAGAVAPDDVAIAHPQQQQQQEKEFGGYCVEAGGVGRGKRRPVDEAPSDRVSQQRQRRMIKNRESAARSRERKQAYTVELEALVMQLEEENVRLVREEAERSRKRFMKLMENVVPVGKKKQPLRAHRRVQSVGW